MNKIEQEIQQVDQERAENLRDMERLNNQLKLNLVEITRSVWMVTGAFLAFIVFKPVESAPHAFAYLIWACLVGFLHWDRKDLANEIKANDEFLSARKKLNE